MHRLPSISEALEEFQHASRRVSRAGGRATRVAGQVVNRSQRAAKRAAEEQMQKYLAHERLLVLFFRSRGSKLPRVIDPMARWRMWWRWFGVLLLLLHCTALTLSAWARYRCGADSGPLLHIDSSQCIAKQGDYGYRRTLVAEATRIAVQIFSAGELWLGVQTARSMRGLHSTSPVRQFQYGEKILRLGPVADLSPQSARSHSVNPTLQVRLSGRSVG